MKTAVERYEGSPGHAGSDRNRALPRRNTAAFLAWTCALLLTVIALRIPVFLDPSGPDSMAFAYGGWVIAEGGKPYVDFVDNKPPGIYLLNACVLSVFPPTPESILLFETLWVLATTGVVFLLARRVLGVGGAKWAALLFAFTVNLLYLSPAGNMTETYALLPVSLAYLAFFSWGTGGKGKLGLLFLTGALFALAGQFRPTAVLPILPLSGATIVFRSANSSRMARLRAFLVLWAGFFGLSTAVIALLGVWGVLGAFFDFVLVANAHYIESVDYLPVHRIFKGLGYAGPALVLGIVALPRCLRSPDPVFRVLGLCFLADFAGSLISRHWFGHYFIQPLIPAVILAVRLIGDVTASPSGTGTLRARLSGRPGKKTVALAGLFLILLGFALFEEARSVARLRTRRADGDIRYLREASQYVSATTAAEDFILCTGFGRATGLYFLSGRMAPTRFYYTHYLDRAMFGDDLFLEAATREYLRDIREREPVLVILRPDGEVALPEPYAEEFRDLLRTGYRHDRDIGEFRFLRRRSGSGREVNG